MLINALHVTGTNITTMERYYLGEEIAKVIGSRLKPAIVWPEKDINKFAENGRKKAAWVTIKKPSTNAPHGIAKSHDRTIQLYATIGVLV